MGSVLESFAVPRPSRKERLAFIPPTDILVEPDQLEEYLHKTHGDVRELPNEGTIVSFYRGVSDSRKIRVTATARHYPMFDSKCGITHFSEHFFIPNAQQQAYIFDVEQSAGTDWECVDYTAEGDGIPDVTEFGMFPFIPYMVRKFGTGGLFEGVPDSQRMIEREGWRIIPEIEELNGNHNRLFRNAMRKHYFASENPRSDNDKHLGVISDIVTITRAEIEEHNARILVPGNLVFEVLTQGSQQDNTLYVDKLEEAIRVFPAREPTPDDVPIELHDRMNPEFHDGGVTFSDTGLQNNLVTIQFAWQLEAPQNSLADFTLQEYSNLADKATNRASRKYGWGYSVGAHVENSPGKNTIFYIRVKISTAGVEKRDPEAYAKLLRDQIREEVINLPDDSIANNNYLQKLRREHVPTHQADRLKLAMVGMQQYCRVIDPRKQGIQMDRVTPKNVMDLRDHIYDRIPDTFICGDGRSFNRHGTQLSFL